MELVVVAAAIPDDEAVVVAIRLFQKELNYYNIKQQSCQGQFFCNKII
jgi:hypothetical protein